MFHRLLEFVLALTRQHIFGLFKFSFCVCRHGGVQHPRLPTRYRRFVWRRLQSKKEILTLALIKQVPLLLFLDEASRSHCHTVMTGRNTKEKFPVPISQLIADSAGAVAAN